MKVTRRDFLYSTVGAAATVYGLQGRQDISWSSETEPDLGWTPGIETWANSTCLICPGRCGIRGRAVDGKLIRIIGSNLHPMSNGGVCPRGAAGMQVLYHPKRLAGPVLRVGPRGAGQWREVSHSGAVSLIADKLRALREAGTPERVGLVSGYCAGSMYDLLHQFMSAFGSPNHITDAYPDGTDAIMSLMHGIKQCPGYDLDRSDLVISFGAPLFESWTSPVQAFSAFAGRSSLTNTRRPRIVQVDTRFSRTASRAHEWIGVRPGTHGVLALGVAYILIRDGLVNSTFLAEHVAGYEDFRDRRGRRVAGYRSQVLRSYRTEEVSRITGVPIDRITALAKAIAASEAPVAVCGTDVTFDRQGLLDGMAVHSLNILLGRINTPGGVLFGPKPPIAPLASVEHDATARASLKQQPIGGPPPSFGTGVVPTDFAQAVSEQDSIDILFLYYSNPLASSTHPETWRSALSRIPFVVSFSPFVDETSSQADLIVPDLLPYERWQDAPNPETYPYPVWGLSRPLVTPYQGGRHTGDVFLDVARALGGSIARSLPYADFQALLKVRAQGLFAARHGMILGEAFERRQVLQMEERGWWLPDHDNFDDFWSDLVESGGWTDLYYDYADKTRIAGTPDRRINLMPPALLRLLDESHDVTAPYVLRGDNEAEPADKFPLRLLPFRVSTLSSGTISLERWLAEQPGIFPDVQWMPWIGVHPRTAETLGFQDRSVVWVVSPRGRYRAVLRFFPGTAPGNVCAPYGLRHPDGEPANPLRLLIGDRDVFTGLTDWHSTFIRLERA